MSNDQSFKNRKPGMGKAEPGTIKRIFSYIFQCVQHNQFSA